MPRKATIKPGPDDESGNADRPDEDDEREITRDPTDIALFIDWENLKWSLRDIGRVPNISSILDAARERGRVVVATAYADWQQGGHHLDPPNLYRAGISPVYIPSRSGEGKIMKNSADIKLAVDVIDYSHTFPHVNTFVIVSGDADLVHLATYLRMQGKFVIAIGVSGASSMHLSDTVDEFLLYDVDIEPSPSARQRQPAQQGANEKRTLQRMFNNLITVVKREAREGQGVSFSGISGEMRHRYDFQPRRIGVSGFKQFMQEAENKGVIKIVTEGMQDFAYLPEHFAAIEREEEEGSQVQADDDDASVKLSDLDTDDTQRLMQAVINLESKSKYLRMPYVVANLRSSSTLPNLSRAQLKSLLKDAMSQGVFSTGSREVKSHATGAPIELDTIEVNRTHPLVESVLARQAVASTGPQLESDVMPDTDVAAAD
jgi:uncharacterized LabA/DUF88 family protein